MEPLQETGGQVGAAGGQCHHFSARSRAHPACQLPSLLPGKELAVSRLLRARRESGPNPPSGGCRLTSPCTPLRTASVASTPWPRGRAFALPSSFLRKDPEFPPPRGRREKQGLDSRPSPSRAKPPVRRPASAPVS